CQLSCLTAYLGVSSFLLIRREPSSPLFPYTTLFRSRRGHARAAAVGVVVGLGTVAVGAHVAERVAGGGVEHLVVAASGACKQARSEEHTSELQSRENLVCRLLLEKKKQSVSTSTTDS